MASYIELAHYVRHFCQWILKFRHYLDIICQLSTRVPWCVSCVKTEQSVWEDDRLYQNNNMYTWLHILSWCTMPNIFASEFYCLDTVYTSFLNFLEGCHHVFPMRSQSNLFGKITVCTRTIICIHGLIYWTGALCQTFLPKNFKV